MSGGVQCSGFTLIQGAQTASRAKKSTVSTVRTSNDEPENTILCPKGLVGCFVFIQKAIQQSVCQWKLTPHKGSVTTCTVKQSMPVFGVKQNH